MGIFFLKQLARLPFGWHYAFSRILFLVVYHLARYRRKVVMKNLKSAFPGYSDSEIRQISKRFYKHFSELTMEIIKMGEMTAEDFHKRMIVTNPELLHRYYDQGQSLIALTMHFNNWEWSSCLALHLKHSSLGVYKPLHNKHYNDHLNNNRSRLGAEMIPNHMVLRRILKARKRGELFFLWLAGDQTPPWYHTFWLRFLNRDALFYPGPATLSRKFNIPVIFQKTLKTARGKYETTFEVLFDNPADYTEAQIMKAYILKMEEAIREQPEHYLWSHRKWKNKRPEGAPLME